MAAKVDVNEEYTVSKLAAIEDDTTRLDDVIAPKLAAIEDDTTRLDDVIAPKLAAIDDEITES